MPNLFSSQAGRVAQVDGLTMPMSLRIGDVASAKMYAAFRGFTRFKAIVTGIGIQEQCSYQIMHTLGQFLYIYSFGERVGDLVISGVGFVADCKDSLDRYGFLSKMTGFEHMAEFYRLNRFSTTGKAMSISIGTSLALSGFLVALKADIVDPGTQLAQFSMHFKYPPRNTSGADDSGASGDFGVGAVPNNSTLFNSVPVPPVIQNAGQTGNVPPGGVDVTPTPSTVPGAINTKPLAHSVPSLLLTSIPIV